MAFHQAVFALGLFSYAVGTILVAILMHRLRGARHYGAVWGWLLAASSTCVVVAVVRWWSLFYVQWFMELLADPSDGWGLKTFVIVMLYFWWLPLPLALAALCTPPRSVWWKSASSLLPFAAEGIVLISLHLGFHGTCTVTVRDQYKRPVPNAEIDFCTLGSHVTDRYGRIRLAFYGHQRRLHIESAKASGYVIDHRLASFDRRGPIPRTVALPAWALRYEPHILLSRSRLEAMVPDGEPYYFNLLRAQVGREPFSTTDLVVGLARVDAGLEAPCPWLLKIRVPDGGLQIAAKGYRLVAPERGYQATWVGVLPPGEKSNQCIEAFYLTMRSGRAFALAEISVLHMEDGSDLLYVEATVNPLARRSLHWGAGAEALSPSQGAAWLRTLFGEEY